MPDSSYRPDRAPLTSISQDPAAQAPPGYSPNQMVPGGFMNMVAYLKSRGYSDDLAKTLAANIAANPNTRANAELVAGAQAFGAKNAAQYSQDRIPIFPGEGQFGPEGPEGDAARSGAKADSLASYFQRLGMDPRAAVNLAHTALGRPQAQDQAPMEHVQTQVAEHPPISPEVYQAVLGASTPGPGEGSADSNYTWDGQKWTPSKGK